MATIICASGCDSELAPVSFNECQPNIVASEITKIYITNATGDGFTAVRQLAEWTPRLSQTRTHENDDPLEPVDLNVIRTINVIGDRPVSTSSPIAISNGRQHTANRANVINFEMDEISEENHDFVRTIQACGGTFKFWYETMGGLLFGGNDGIKGSFNVDMQLDRGQESHMRYSGTITWNGKVSEEYVLSPFA